MPVYHYVAKDIQGQYHKGDVESSDEHQASTLLRRKRLIVLSLKARNEASEKFFDQIFSRVSFSDVVMITRQLATMISAGLVLSEALDILAEEQTNKKLKKVMDNISSDVKGGSNLAATLQKYPEIFPPLYSKLVAAGQESGKLDTILLQLATNLEKEREFRGRIKGAMIYPVVVLVMMTGVMLIMIFFVMPKLTGLYQDSGTELPLPTQIVLGFTNFMLRYWWLVFLAIVGAVVAFKRYTTSPKGKIIFDAVILKVPVVGRIVNLVMVTTFTRTFALLVSAGISILDSIRIVGEIVGNSSYQQAFQTAYKGVERGLTLSNQILGLPVFPRIVGQMIKTGEETGKLDEIMFKMADYFDSEVDMSLKNITTLIEPLVLVILGIGVAFLVISVILPIYQLTTAIK